MRKRWMILLVCTVLGIAAAIGLASKLSKKDRPRVVVVLKGPDTQYWQIVKAGAEKGFRDFDIDGKVVLPSLKSKQDVQENTLKDVLKEHPDVLIVAPDESSSVQSLLQGAISNKIPVLLLDTDISLKHKTAYIGTDNFDLGRKAGELLASQLQPGDEVALIGGYSTSQVIGPRINGAKFSLEAAGIKIAAEAINLENESVPVKKAMTTILQEHPDIKGVYATTDIMALSALQVMKEQGYKLPVVGADGIIQMTESVADGTLTGTVAQNPYDMGFIGVETALKVIKGDTVPELIDSGVDIITKDNAKEKLAFLQDALKGK